MEKLKTWAGRSSFEYSGSVKNGTTIMYGNGHEKIISREQYISLLNHFKGKTVDAGTSRTNAPQGSVGEWLQTNITKTAVSSYVCPILIAEGYAEKDRSQIKFSRK